jgi:hypothetical protein
MHGVTWSNEWNGMMRQLIRLRPLGENPLRSSLAAAVSKMSKRPEFLSDCKISGGLPIFRIGAEHSEFPLSRAIADWFGQLEITAYRECHSLPLYRGVPLAACERVFANGIDVLPTDAVIWANDLQKASEYGGQNRLIMILNQSGMRRSYITLDESADAETRRRVEQEYGTEPIIFPKGTIFYSRLAPMDRRRGSPYEVENGWYIPNDPFKVLSGMIVCGRGRRMMTLN